MVSNNISVAVEHLIHVVREQTIDRDDALFGDCIIKGQSMGRSILPELKKYIQDSSCTVREYVMELLYLFKDTSSIPILLSFLTSYEIRDRMTAMALLQSLSIEGYLATRDNETFRLLLRAILSLSSDFVERNFAIRCLLNIEPTSNLAPLLHTHLTVEHDPRMIHLMQAALARMEEE